ncbi:hypothetical protein PENTCL1PPCAC_21813, partial [Pristionchus entomophagus]
PSHGAMFYGNPNNGPSIDGVDAGYPCMQRPPLLPNPVVQPMVPPGYNEEYAKWAQWNSHVPMNPTTAWRNQAAAAPRPTPYDRPFTAANRVPYGGRPFVPRGPSSGRITTLGAAAVPSPLNQKNAYDLHYNGPVQSLDFDVNVSSTKLDIIWKAPHVSGQITYEMSVAEGRNFPFVLFFPAHHTRHSLRVKAGMLYFISITARIAANGATVAQGQKEIKAIFSEAELRVLYDNAVKHTGTDMHPFEIIYRCKPKMYWDNIHHNCFGVMEKYMKDDNGQPANMINGVISGLFFSAHLLLNGQLPTRSCFGNVRMMVQAVMFLDPSTVNIYFADFYCFKQAHYVTIVVARKGSDSDIHSQKYLIQLNMRDNPWLKYMV